ncbi:MAG: hypothetical protein K9J21_11410 [Bacteroidales bacterium]|nr:hypothetical protein [Bacteroidales bacterium]
MNTRTTITFIIILLTTGVAGAQIDVFQNTNYETIRLAKSVLPENDHISGKVDVTYFGLQQPAPEGTVEISPKIFELCRRWVDNPKEYLKLHKLAEERLGVVKYIMSIAEDLNVHYNELNDLTFGLKSIDCKPISVVDSKMFFHVEFEFKLFNNPYFRYYENFVVSKFFTVDLRNAEVASVKVNLTNKMTRKIKKQISPALHKLYDTLSLKQKLSGGQMLLSLDKYNYMSEPERIRAKDSLKAVDTEKNILKYINLNEADFYWYGWGVMVRFQEYTKSSKIFLGNSVSIFIPYDEARKIFSDVSEFTFLQELRKKPVKVENFHYDYKDRINGIHEYTTQPDIHDLIRINSPDKLPEMIVRKSYYKKENGDTSFHEKSTWTFDEQGKPIVYKTWNLQGLYRSVFYYYNEAGNITRRKTNFETGNKVYVKEYSYDKKENIVQWESFENFNFSRRRFFYNGNYGYYFDHLNSNYNRLVPEYGIDELCFETDKLYVNDFCYYFNEEGDLLGKKSDKYVSQKLLLARDEKGRISESYREGERDANYYSYDSLGRLKSWISDKKKVTFNYTDDSYFPSKKTVQTNDYYRPNIISTYKVSFYE